MKAFDLVQLLSWLPGARVLSAHPTSDKRSIQGISTDTRSVQTGDLFIALKGEKFDAHDFLHGAYQSGATVALVNTGATAAQLGVANSMVLVGVLDTRLALQTLAHAYRAQFKMPMALVVGSNGKTTVKEMIHSIFKTHCDIAGGQVDAAHCTQGNFNNDIGLPLTLLRLNESHRYSTVELGMNHRGETAVLAELAAPTIAVINNAQREHQEFMHTVEAVAQEHADVIASVQAGGTLVLPAQDAYCALWRNKAAHQGVKVIDFALHRGLENQTNADSNANANTNAGIYNSAAAVTGTRTEQGLNQTLNIQTPAGSCTVVLASAGEHNARNALAATAAALAAGVPLNSVVAGLQAFNPVKGRMRQHQIVVAGAAITVIDDSYNANPDSVAAAINVLGTCAGHTVLVLGDMGEVGEQGADFHAQAGQHAARWVDAVYTLGALSRHTQQTFHNMTVGQPKTSQHFADVASLNIFLNSGVLSTGSTVLVKGSRFMRMERAVDALLGTAPIPTAGVH